MGGAGQDEQQVPWDSVSAPGGQCCSACWCWVAATPVPSRQQGEAARHGTAQLGTAARARCGWRSLTTPPHPPHVQEEEQKALPMQGSLRCARGHAAGNGVPW